MRSRTTRTTVPAATAALLLPLALSGCAGSAEGSDGTRTTVTIGYQSKTINTTTAGTLLRSLGYFERELRALGKREGRTYEVRWQDYATGAPITAQMTAGKVDIGSMGDFPLLINAARGKQLGAPTRLVSVTGYNLRGGLNTIVVRRDARLDSVADLKGKKVSASVGSAGDGTLVQALGRAGIDPEDGVRKLNQQPAVGASALEGQTVDALSQFVAWPGLLAFQGKAKALYDGGQLGVPTFHGVVVRQAFGTERPEVLGAFLKAQAEAGRYLAAHPLDASRKVAAATGLPPEVVHLYNGPHGTATFDPTLKPQLVAALRKDAELLRKAGLTGPVDVRSFVDDGPLRKAYGAAYGAQLKKTAGPVRTGEVWLKGEDRTRSFPDAAAALRFVASHEGRVRAAYVPDAVTGTRWFADRAVWVRDGDALLPFVAPATARDWLHDHPGARIVGYAAALKAAARAEAERAR
ncbi:ABC transporter substrate-binding protein [Streptomyces sp. NPDC002446]